MPQSDFILKTKFFLPQVSTDFIVRNGLKSKFDLLRTTPVMLVSASSGYGKSMVISHFLKNQDNKYVWLSLSEKENDFSQFIRYFIVAIQVHIPDFGLEILDLMDVPNPPSVDDFSEYMQNELAEISELLYMAIDDYHLIKNRDVHQFVAKLFEYTQPFFRLIILTRRDPELPLSIWRSKQQLIEIRSSHLKFDKQEISVFYSSIVKNKVEDSMIASILKITEGWVSGLRMLMLSADPENQNEAFINSFNFKNTRVILDLVDAVLSRQTPETKERLLKLSLLNEFNLDLFTELCLTKEEHSFKEDIYNDFMSELINSNMFITSLDDRRNWYRFHHLFQEQLGHLLGKEMDREVIKKLRVSAAEWYLLNNFTEEAIDQLIKAGQLDKALEIFEHYRLILISETRFQHLERILNCFPENFIQTKGVLLVTEGWILLQKGNIPKMAEHIKPLESFVKKEAHQEELLNLLLGELHTMKTFDTYLSNVDLGACLEHCKSAIQLLNGRHPYALGMAWVYYGATLQHLGKTDQAKKEVFKILEYAEEPMLKGHLLLIVCFLDWFEGNLDTIIETADHLLTLGQQSGIKMLVVNGNIFKGISLYYQNKDEEAKDYLLKSHELRHYTYLHMSFGTGMALADILAKAGNLASKDEIIKTYSVTALQQGGKLFNNITKSASAEIKWRYQKEKSGLKWALENDYSDFLPLASLFSPEIVQAGILVLDNDSASLGLSQKILDMNIQFFEGRNDKNVLIRAYVIQALLYYKRNQKDKAFSILKKVLPLTAPGHFVRPFTELGNEMKDLLQAYGKTIADHRHLNEILLFFEDVLSDKIVLSVREKEVLELSQGRTNKEIGNTLFISEKTVKTHITNINKKLKVNNKLQAIAKAKALSLID